MTPIALIILPYLAAGLIAPSKASEVQERVTEWLEGKPVADTQATDLDYLVRRIIKDLDEAS